MIYFFEVDELVVFRVVICHFARGTKDKYVLSSYLGFVRKATSVKHKKGVRSHFFCSRGLTTTALVLLQSLRQWLNKDTHAVFFFSFHKEDISIIIFLLARPLFILKRSRLDGN